MRNTEKHIVLDLGGVLIQLDWERRVGNLLGHNFDRQAVLQLWHDSKAVNGLETGQISFDAFAELFKQEFNIKASIATIKEEFLLFVQDPYPGIDELFAYIKSKGYGLSLLSNTSDVHFSYLSSKNSFFKHFDQLFLSYEIGIMKPDDRIYQHIIHKLGCPAENIYFFDDGIKNVEAAKNNGINAFCVNSPSEIKPHIP